MIYAKDRILAELDSAGAQLASLAADLKANYPHRYQHVFGQIRPSPFRVGRPVITGQSTQVSLLDEALAAFYRQGFLGVTLLPKRRPDRL